MTSAQPQPAEQGLVRPKATVVDTQELSRAGGSSFGPGGIQFGDWRFEVREGGIAGDAEIEETKAQLNAESFVSLPEQLFADNVVSVTHVPSGISLKFDARGALRGWRDEAMPPLRLSVAATWQQSHEREIQHHGAALLDYDWTYTTGYQGETRVNDTRRRTHSAAAVQALELSNGTGADDTRAYTWRGTSKRIDMALLQRRDPLLMWTHVPLFESELEDNGCSTCQVKMRVMPTSWLLLLRFWLRVDGHLLRLRETRVFGDMRQGDPPSGTDPNTWSPGMVLRETTWYEATYEQLRARGIPSSDVHFKDPDTVRELLASRTTGLVTRHVVEELSLNQVVQTS